MFTWCSQWVPSEFMFLLVGYGKVLCSIANELQQNSDAFLENNIFQEYWQFCSGGYSHVYNPVYIWPLWLFVFVCHSETICNNVTTMSNNQSSWPESGQFLRHQHGISVAEAQTFLLAKHPQRRGTRRNGCIRRLGSWKITADINKPVFNYNTFFSLSLPNTHVLPCCRPSSWPVSNLHLRTQNCQSDRELKLVWSQGQEWPTESRSTCTKWNLILILPRLLTVGETNGTCLNWLLKKRSLFHRIQYRLSQI